MAGSGLPLLVPVKGQGKPGQGTHTALLPFTRLSIPRPLSWGPGILPVLGAPTGLERGTPAPGLETPPHAAPDSRMSNPPFSAARKSNWEGQVLPSDTISGLTRALHLLAEILPAELAV